MKRGENSGFDGGTLRWGGTATRAALAALAALLIGVVSLLIGPAGSAHAQPGTITSVDFDKQEFDDGSRQQIDVEWRVDGAAEQPVTVSVELPEELSGYSDRFDMLDPDGEVAGECVVTERAVECTVDPAYVESHPLNMSGSFQFWVDVRVGNDDSTEHEFDFGHDTATVTVNPVPDEPCVGDCDYDGQHGWKGGWLTESENHDIVWQVGIPAPADGLPAGRAITVKDHLDTDLYEIVDGPRVLEARSLEQAADGSWQPDYRIRTEGLDVSEGGTKVAFESVAGLGGAEVPEGNREISGSIYMVEWRVQVVGGLESGVEYTNSAEWAVEGGESGEDTGTVVRQGGSGDVVGENEGAFSLTKELAGDADLDPGFTVEYAVDGVPQEDIAIGAGETFTSESLPEGSTVTLEEVEPAGPDNVTWADPVFVLPDGTETERVDLTFSSENGNLGGLTEIRLLNEASLNVGEFSVAKRIEGDGAALVPDDAEFTVGYEYAEGPGYPAGDGELVVPADGSVVASGPLPAGAEVRLTELDPGDVPGATWEGAEFSADTVVIGEDTTVEVTLTNTISTGGGPGGSGGSDRPDEGLSDTGGGAGPFAWGAGAALLLAGSLLLAARARRSAAGR